MQNMHNKTDYPFDYFFEHTTSKEDSSTDSDQTSSVSEGLVVEETKGSKVKGDVCDIDDSSTQ